MPLACTVAADWQKDIGVTIGLIAQLVESQHVNPEVRGSHPPLLSTFLSSTQNEVIPSCEIHVMLMKQKRCSNVDFDVDKYLSIEYKSMLACNKIR